MAFSVFGNEQGMGQTLPPLSTAMSMSYPNVTPSSNAQNSTSAISSSAQMNSLSFEPVYYNSIPSTTPSPNNSQEGYDCVPGKSKNKKKQILILLFSEQLTSRQPERRRQ
jgi:hypothetical protein